MSIKMTVSNQLQTSKKGYSGIQKHTEHDPSIEHSNKNIDVDRTRFNVYQNTKERKKKLQDWQEKKFGKFVEDHDKHQRETGHGERQIGSVKNYINSKNKATLVLTLGNVKSQGELMKLVCPSDVLTTKHSVEGYDYITFDLKVHKDKNGKPLQTKEEHDRLVKVNREAKKFYGTINKALLDATSNKIYWKRGKTVVRLSDYLFIGRRATNLDEGTGHLHAEVGTCGLTRKGNKLTSSLNQSITTLCERVTGKRLSGRKATSWLRDDWDSIALYNYERELEKSYPDKIPEDGQFLKLERKTKDDPTTVTGLSMKQYKNKQRLEDRAKQDQAEAEKAKEEAQKAQKDAETSVTEARDELNRLRQRIRQRRQERRQRLQKELDENGLVLNDSNKKPVVTDNNVTKYEKWFNDWKNQQVQQWKNDKSNYESQNTKLKDENSKLTNQNVKLKKQNQQFKDLKTQSEKLKKQVENLKKSNEKLRNQQTNLQKSVNNLTNRVQKLTYQVANKTRQLTKPLRSEIARSWLKDNWHRQTGPKGYQSDNGIFVLLRDVAGLMIDPKNTVTRIKSEFFSRIDDFVHSDQQKYNCEHGIVEDKQTENKKQWGD